MKKLAPILLLFALALSALSLYRIDSAHGLSTAPWTDSFALQNLSRAGESPDASLVAISDSKQRILKLSPDGVLQANIGRSSSESGQRRDFTEVVTDGAGNVYAIDTVLDDYGLYVLREQIVRYDAAGKHRAVLYDWEGDGSGKRIGQLKALRVLHNDLYFFVAEADKVSLMRISLAGGQPQEQFSFLLPKNRYMSEIVGTSPGQIYYSTKKGAVFQVSAAGESKLVYPLENMERTRKNFPERLSLGQEGHLTFVDRSLNAVTVLEPGRADGIRVLAASEDLERSAPGAEGYELMDVASTSDGGFIAALSDRVLRFDADAKLSGAWAQAEYAGDEKTADWLRWAVLVAAAILVLYSLRAVYIHTLKRKMSLFFKMIVVTAPVIVACMFLLANFIYDSFSARMEQEMQRELSLLARNGQNLIDGDALGRIQSPQDFRNDDYNAIRAKMNFLFEGEYANDRQGLYSTLYKYEGDQLNIIMDDDDGVNMFKPFETNEENEAVRKDGMVRSGQWEDANGKWLYAIGPVYDNSGQVVGIYETGRDMSVLDQANRKIYTNIVQNIVIITSVLLFVILLVTFLLLSSLRKLQRSVMAMADGNWDTEVKLRSRDEVGDLGEQFNRMARYIRQYIADITQFSEASFRFVPQQIFKSLGKKGILDIRLGDQVQQNMAVMVANLRDFHRYAQTLSPKDNFDFMNSFLRRFGPIVREEDGLISKYLGAGFMALYPGYAEQALQSAVTIRRELGRYNEDRRKAGYEPVDIGIAIHKGPLMLGIIGEERRWEGNVISDDVHLTALLEKLSAELGSTVLVTKTFFEQLREPERFRHRSLGRITPEGHGEAVELIDVYEGDPDTVRLAKDRTKALFERGLLLCQEGRFFDARETFVEVIKLNRLDKAAKLYFYLCDEYYQKGSQAGWNGTLAM
ncbi:HAMP domain-containing protein [Cohnella sp. GCM10027633]|uniref:HAMP domain-containing protein n=1 Tax=unclassified Cohnella TaxID=2636738 RepID=UPI00362A3403